MRISDWSSDVCSSDLFLHKFASEMNSQVKGFSPDALAAMNSWGWPGNVRELENRMKRAVIMADGKLITAPDPDLDGDEEGELMLNLKAARAMADRQAIRPGLHRKSVVAGKRGSVCGDPGGRRTLSKKHK